MKLPCLSLLGSLVASALAFGADAPITPPARGNAALARGTQLAPPAKEIALYSGIAPGSENWTWTERAAGSPTNPTIQNVVHPVLMYYPADKARSVGTAVIVAPGGGFRNLMMSYEGVDIAKRLNEMGVDAFVLKYRLRFTDPNAPARGATQPSAPAPTRSSVRDRPVAAPFYDRTAG
jgi:acetyl esterase/lipase